MGKLIVGLFFFVGFVIFSFVKMAATGVKLAYDNVFQTPTGRSQQLLGYANDLVKRSFRVRMNTAGHDLAAVLAILAAEIETESHVRAVPIDRAAAAGVVSYCLVENKLAEPADIGAALRRLGYVQ